MDRRALIGAGMAATAATMAGVASMAGGALGQERRRLERRAGLLLEDIEGEVLFLDRGSRRERRGTFEGDILVTQLILRRRGLRVAGIIDGEASVERGRGRDIEIDEQAFVAEALLEGSRWRDVSLDIGRIRLRALGVLVDPDAVDLEIRGRSGRELEALFAKLAAALEDEDDRRRREKDDDPEALVDSINRLLRRELFVVGRRRRAA